MQTSVADSTSAVANPTFNDLLHNAEILTQKENILNPKPLISFIMTGSKMLKESVRKI